MAIARIVFLGAASGWAMFPVRKLPSWIGPAVLAVVALAAGVLPWTTARHAGADLWGALAFLVVAVPLAVLLDEAGFFAAIAAIVDGGRRLRVNLWIVAALVTVVFNLDAAVVLLTPLYVQIAKRRDLDPVTFGFIPALLASLASSILPVSNLTNLIVAEPLDLGAASFLAHLALPSLAAIAIGLLVFIRITPREAPGSSLVDDPVDRASLRIGLPVVAWLLLGFTVGERLGVPAWLVALVALIALAVRMRTVPWRHVPYEATLLAAGLGGLAAAAAPHLHVERLLGISGVPGELATIGATALGSNAINNLPAVLVTLPALHEHTDRVWAVLLGVNLGPTLWVTGALSTLLWQATMSRLGHPVSARRYAATAARVGVPAIVAATAVHLVLVTVG